MSVKPLYLFHIINKNKGDIGVYRATRELVRRHLPGVELREVGWHQLSAEKIDEVNREGSGFVLAGSGVYQCDAAGRIVAGVIDKMDLSGIYDDVDRFTVPVVAYAVGYNRNFTFPSEPDEVPRPLDAAAAAAARRIAAKCAIHSVRDPGTQRALSAVGVPSEVVADPGLFLSAGRVPHGLPARRPLVGLNLAHHGTVVCDEAYGPRIREAMIGCLRRLHAERGAALVYLQHEAAEKPVVEALRRALPLAVVDADPEDLVATYAGLDLAVTNMMHASIFAAGAGTPVVCVAYDVKQLGFMELLGEPGYLARADRVDAGSLHALACRALDEGGAYRARLARRRAELWAAQEEFLRRLAGIVGGAELRRTGT